MMYFNVAKLSTNVSLGGNKVSRITQVHRILEQKRLDAIIILSDYNRRYLSEILLHRLSGALISKISNI